MSKPKPYVFMPPTDFKLWENALFAAGMVVMVPIGIALIGIDQIHHQLRKRRNA